MTKILDLSWQTVAIPDMAGIDHVGWQSPELLYGLRLLILDLRKADHPVLIADSTIDTVKLSARYGDAKGFCLLNDCPHKPRLEVNLTLHPTRGEAQERANIIHQKYVSEILLSGHNPEKHSDNKGLRRFFTG